MSVSKTGFLILGLVFSALLLVSCAEEGKQVAKADKDKGKDTDPVLAEGKPGGPKNTDPSAILDSDPTLPTTKTPKTSGTIGPNNPDGINIGSGLKTPDINKPKVSFDLPKIKSDLPIAPGEVVVPALKKHALGMIEPKLNPQLIALTVVGGAGDQWIQEVGFTGDGKIYALSGGGTFTVFYSGDGAKFLEVKGDIQAPSTGPRGALFDTRDNRAFRTTCPTTGTKMALGTVQVGKSLQPYLHAGDWKWWDCASAADLKGIDANTRGVRLCFLHDGKFLAKAVCDAANSSLTKDPREIKSDNITANNMPNAKTAGPLTLYMAGAIKNGEPFYGAFLKGRIHAEAVDSWERLYVSQLPEGKDAKDAFRLGGKAGITVLNNLLAETVWSTSLGADDIYSMALNHNILIVGGSIGQRIDLTTKSKVGLDPNKLRQINPAQFKPGGDEDGFLAIIKLW